jgi:TRAP-type C4-dicarboxylate transport system substrate-binding protein
MRIRLAALALGLVAALPAASGAAEPIKLKFAYPSAPQGPLPNQGFIPWTEEVNRDSDGTLEVKVFAGPTLGNYGNIYDRLLSGVTEIAWGIIGPISSQFPKTNVVTLPFESRNGREAALALWRLYERGLIAEEWDKVKLLDLSVFPNVLLHSRGRQIKTLADMKGLKVSAEGRYVGLSVQRLGGAPVTMPVTQLYQSIDRGLIDAIAIAWPAIVTFKLNEVTSYHLEIPLANDDGFVAMNKAAYAGLPAKARAAIDKHSGEALVRHMIATIHDMTAKARETTKGMAGQTVAQLSPAEEARWRQTLAPVTAQWVKDTPNGAAILAAFREEIGKIRAGM